MQIDWAIITQVALAIGGTFMAVLGFLSARTLNKIDTNQTELFNRLHVLETDFYTLKGEHNATHKGER